MPPSSAGRPSPRRDHASGSGSLPATDFPAGLTQRVDTVRQAYARGVPMGGDLLPSKGKAPSFLVWAVRDPNSG